MDCSQYQRSKYRCSRTRFGKPGRKTGVRTESDPGFSVSKGREEIQELAALPNANGGVLLDGTGHGNVIGTPIVGNSPVPSPSALLNIISGNGGDGIEIDGSANTVAMNNIGTDVSGTVASGHGQNGGCERGGD